MCRAGGDSRIILLCGVVLCAVASTGAQDLQVSPLSWDFGSVAVGSSEMVTFDLLAGPPSPLWMYVIGLNDTPTLSGLDELDAYPYHGVWSSGAFSLNPLTYPVVPAELSVGSHYFVDVTFAPPSPGSFNAWLYIYSNDSIDGPGMQACRPSRCPGLWCSL